MRLDVHAYVGHWPFRQLRGNTCRELIGKMDRYGVDRTVVASLNGLFYKNPQSANEELAREVKPYGRRFIPFAVLNPTYADWKHDLDVCARQLGMKGLRLYPQYHDYRITDERCIEIVKLARDRGLPIAFSLRLVDDRQRSWLDVQQELRLEDIAAVVDRVPDAKYLVLHAFFSRESEATTRTLKQANVLFDTTYGATSGIVGPVAWDLVQAVEVYGKTKFAFGTAAPFRDYVSPLLRIQIFKEAGEETRALIWSGNASRMLGVA